MSGLIIFLHGLRGDSSHWGEVPTYVASGLSSFITVSLEYSAEIRGHADIEGSATQVLTKIRRVYQKHDPIFIVGYSMGGLVAREVCLKLLESPDDSELLKHIQGVITFGSPLSGLRRGMLEKAAEKLKNRLTKKVSQLTTNFVFGRYNTALAAAFERGISGPKQIHYEIENDEIAEPHDRNAYTRDDIHAGAIGGAHRGFLNTKEAQVEVADLLLKQIEQGYSALGRALRPSVTVGSTYDLADRILLISCSNRKRTGGERIFAGPEPAGWIPQLEFRDEIKAKRTTLLSLLKAIKLSSGFSRGDNRIHQAPNKVLKHGRDFGGVEEGGLYLPAWQRYIGRCYAPIADDSWQGHFRDTSQLAVLIMSGLYGWVDAAEWIQEYDVHLTDTNSDTGVSVSALWTELFTDTLVAYINSAYRDRKVRVYNFLCDGDYVDAIQWHKLPATCSVFHLASPNFEGVDLLPAAGTVIDFLLRHPHGLDEIERCTRELWHEYPLGRFGFPPEGYSETKIVFEATVGEAKKNAKFTVK
jgi:thioesterase domain-containing protein